VMGGCEIDFSQADMQKPATIEISQIFGGIKLIVPSHWQVRTEVASLFSGVEDKRSAAGTSNPDKVLILRGTSVFGGVDIRSF